MGFSIEGMSKNINAFGNIISSKLGKLSGYVIYPLEKGGKFIEPYSQNRVAAVAILIVMCFVIKVISNLIGDGISALIPKS